MLEFDCKSESADVLLDLFNIVAFRDMSPSFLQAKLLVNLTVRHIHSNHYYT